MAQTHTVDIKGMKFVPPSVAAQAGDTVTWTNRDGMPHTVTADGGQFDSGVLAKGQAFSQTVAAGSATVPYHCDIHPGMKGKILVGDQPKPKPSEGYSPEKGRAFWFEFDHSTKYDPAFLQVAGRAGAFGVQEGYRLTRKAGTYPAAFADTFRPRRSGWVTIADIQTSTIEKMLGSDWRNIQAAFEDFGQGTLLDTDPERQANNDSIHTMDVQDALSPPVGYHRWHASIRAIQLLGIGDHAWWENLDRMVAFAWAIQSLARPKQQDTPNPPLLASDLNGLRTAWLDLAPDRRDRQYDSPESEGYHPSPKNPLA